MILFVYFCFCNGLEYVIDKVCYTALISLFLTGERDCERAMADNMYDWRGHLQRDLYCRGHVQI